MAEIEGAIYRTSVPVAFYNFCLRGYLAMFKMFWLELLGVNWLFKITKTHLNKTGPKMALCRL
jgi:hypothetical protein